MKHMGTEFQCQEGNSNYTQKGNIDRHKESVHMGENYPCHQCDDKPSSKVHLTRHKKTDH